MRKTVLMRQDDNHIMERPPRKVCHPWVVVREGKWVCLAVTWLLLLSIGTGLSGCAVMNQERERTGEENPAVREVQEIREEPVQKDSSDGSGQSGAAAIQAMVSRMTLEEKAGQVLMLAYRHRESGGRLLVMDEVVGSSHQSLQPGGIILFAENIESEEQVRSLIESFQSVSSIPLLVAVDEEGGRVSRLTTGSLDFPVIPAARIIGDTEDPQNAFAAGKAIGQAMKALGFSMNMAPVADVDSNPQNPVIGSRSFSQDPVEAGVMAVAMARGMLAEGIIPVLKHFPGHGDTSRDTHLEAVTLPHDIERLSSVELIPFIQGIEAELPAIMTAHLLVPAYDNHFPATLSPRILTGLLRRELGFQGLIITDALEMRAVSEQWDAGTSAVLALSAGADLLLMPADPTQAHQAIIEAVSEGSLPLERLEEAVERILLIKMKAGLLE